MVYAVKGIIISQKGHCDVNHRVGQEFDFTGENCPAMCGSFFHDIFPMARAMKYGADIDWLENKNVARAACPDQANPVVIELRRGKKLGRTK